MSPVAQPDGHDARGLIDEVVPGVAAMIDDIVVVPEHAVGGPVVAHELPDVLHDVELGAFRRQRQQGDIVRHGDVAGEIPAGPERCQPA